jgi:hypothetical protein
MGRLKVGPHSGHLPGKVQLIQEHPVLPGDPAGPVRRQFIIYFNFCYENNAKQLIYMLVEMVKKN